ncbi:MAG: hypothetical protein LKE52_01945 [Bacilli bacterium]|jgi:hypothetical protein|nr:hypothetical protein [Bacilli bacterium]
MEFSCLGIESASVYWAFMVKLTMSASSATIRVEIRMPETGRTIIITPSLLFFILFVEISLSISRTGMNSGCRLLHRFFQLFFRFSFFFRHSFFFRSRSFFSIFHIFRFFRLVLSQNLIHNFFFVLIHVVSHDTGLSGQRPVVAVITANLDTIQSQFCSLFLAEVKGVLLKEFRGSKINLMLFNVGI